MALNGLFCADVPLRNYSLTVMCIQMIQDGEHWKAVEVIGIFADFSWDNWQWWFSSQVCKTFVLFQLQRLALIQPALGTMRCAL